MSTCRCRKLRLDPYEGMDIRARATAATQAGDWQTVRDCFDELETKYLAKYDEERAMAEQAERERDGALSAKKIAEHECGLNRKARDKAEAQLEKILAATPDEVVEAAVEKRLRENNSAAYWTAAASATKGIIYPPSDVYPLF